MRHILLIILSALLASCADTPQPARCILPADCPLRAGDVVFRRGSGLTSHAVIAAERDGVYSHAGLVVDSAGVMMIVHAVPGEPDFEGDVDRVKMDRLDRFFSSVYAQAGAVYRHSDSLAAQRAAQAAVELYRRGVLFDDDYNDLDTTRMYCTELVTHAYARAGVPLNNIAHEKVNFLWVSAAVVLPSALINSGELSLVRQF